MVFNPTSTKMTSTDEATCHCKTAYFFAVHSMPRMPAKYLHRLLGNLCQRGTNSTCVGHCHWHRSSHSSRQEVADPLLSASDDIKRESAQRGTSLYIYNMQVGAEEQYGCNGRGKMYEIDSHWYASHDILHRACPALGWFAGAIHSFSGSSFAVYLCCFSSSPPL